MKLMVSGSNNTAIGSRALSLNPNGKSNVAIGANAGSTLAGGDNNILIGDGAEPSAPTVSNEVTIGNDDTTKTRLKGQVVTTQGITVNSVAVGTGANGKKSNAVLGRNATGSDKNVSGYNNVAIGDDAFASMEGANNSVAVGYHALELNTTGPGNVAVGGESLLRNVEGKNNTAIGYFAGGAMTSGDNNILLGNNAQTSADGVSNEVTIGDDNVTTVRMGNGDILYPSSGGGIPEAPVDGKQYGRQDANWTEVTGGGTLDIDALPALPTELEGTDLFVTERTGTNYKVTADGLSLEATPPTYASWNPLDNNGAVLTVGNLMAKLVSSNNVSATIKPTSGKWYWEISIGAVTGIYIGLKDTDSSATGFATDAVAINSTGDVYANASLQTENGIVSFTNGNVVGVAWDADAKKLWWSKNGQWYTGDLSTAVPIDASEVVAGNRAYDYSSKLGDAKPYIGSSGSPTVTANFGQLTFSYPAPTGFNKISTEG